MENGTQIPHPIKLERASVVFIAEEIAPKMFSHRYLGYNQVVDINDAPKAALTSPVLTRLQYSNGMLFEATERKIKLEMQYTDPLSVTGDVRLPDALEVASERLLKSLAYLSFVAMGINFQVFIEGASVSKLATGLPTFALPTQVSYKFDYDSFVGNIKMQLAHTKEDENEVVSVDANFHLDIPPQLSDDEEIAFLLDFLDRRNTLLNEIRRLVDETQF